MTDKRDRLERLGHRFKQIPRLLAIHPIVGQNKLNRLTGR
jgi:hypothetical protein